MMDWNDAPDRASIDKIINRLKAPVSLDETFDVRVMSAVHAAALANIDQHASAEDEGGPWWRRRFTLRFTAIGALAMAASIFGIFLLSAAMLSKSINDLQPKRTAGVQNVHFILVNDAADQVFLVGDFNGWSKTQTPLVRAANKSSWTVSVPLQQGRHEYAFVVKDDSGEHWVADPLVPAVEDDFGTESSIVRVSAMPQ
ncbi:MAG TPA: glycogen-binding domain-containing protein [Gemmatimonadaceae bacterium]